MAFFIYLYKFCVIMCKIRKSITKFKIKNQKFSELFFIKSLTKLLFLTKNNVEKLLKNRQKHNKFLL